MRPDGAAAHRPGGVIRRPRPALGWIVHAGGVTTGHILWGDAASAQPLPQETNPMSNPTAKTHAAPRRQTMSLSRFAWGLSAWFGGLAFCFGFGVTAPSWVALVLTVLAAGAATVSQKAA
jgi:hypothetical protein